MTVAYCAEPCMQIYHWNEKRKVEDYYYTLAKIQAQPKEPKDEE